MRARQPRQPFKIWLCFLCKSFTLTCSKAVSDRSLFASSLNQELCVSRRMLPVFACRDTMEEGLSLRTGVSDGKVIDRAGHGDESREGQACFLAILRIMAQ